MSGTETNDTELERELLHMLNTISFFEGNKNDIKEQYITLNDLLEKSHPESGYKPFVNPIHMKNTAKIDHPPKTKKMKKQQKRKKKKNKKDPKKEPFIN